MPYKDPAAKAAYHASYRAAHREQSAAYRAAHKEKRAETFAAWYRLNRAANLERCAAWYAANPLKRAAYSVANAEAMCVSRLKWRKENPGKVNAITAKRHAAELQRTPAWADHDKIAEWYEGAAFATEFFGASYHVDHVLPLQGRLVRGLHVE